MAAYLRRNRIHVFPYLDGWLIWGRSKQLVLHNIQYISLSEHLGHIESQGKYVSHNTETQNSLGPYSTLQIWLPICSWKDSRVFLSCELHSSQTPTPHFDPKIIRPHGIRYLCDSTCQALPAQPPGVAKLCLSTNQAFAGQTGLRTCCSPGIFGVVDGSEQCVQRRPVPSSIQEDYNWRDSWDEVLTWGIYKPKYYGQNKKQTLHLYTLVLCNS